jgi:hypothetical protein
MRVIERREHQSLKPSIIQSTQLILVGMLAQELDHASFGTSAIEEAKPPRCDPPSGRLCADAEKVLQVLLAIPIGDVASEFKPP